MHKKRVVLKNGKIANLEIYRLPEIFSIYAIDEQGDIVGQLSFEILRKFSKTLSEFERIKHADDHGLDLSKAKPEIEISVPQSRREFYDIDGNTLNFAGEKFSLKKSVAILNLIEIKREDFFQVGLGKAMHDEFERYAKKAKCNEIRLGCYFPFGNFSHGTYDFYKKVGYIFDKTDGVTQVYKFLDKDLTANQSFGTPINPRFWNEHQDLIKNQ